ncbi:MAG: APH(3') family aminoglycoside O-phosphotransferase [candidate division FCPU426 bacterium]
MSEEIALPSSMRSALGDKKLTLLRTPGKTADKIFLVSDGKDGILKISATRRDELEAHAIALKWLSGKLPVSELYAFVKTESLAALLTSAIEGTDASEWCKTETPERVAEACALALLKIHALAPEGCPLDARLDRRIQEAKVNLDAGLVDLEDLDEVRQGRPGPALFQELIDRRPPSEDLVFVHGDYCLPNIFVKDDMLTGFVDLGRCGIADRYQDLALLCRSLKFNLGKDMVQVVADVYGQGALDSEKLDYYCLLDEFF